MTMKEEQESCESNVEQHKRQKLSNDMPAQLNSPGPALVTSDISNDEASDSEDSEVDPALKEEIQKTISGLRTWQWTAIGQEHNARKTEGKPTGLELTLMCYNVLSQELIELNRYLYDHCKSSLLKWQYRKDNLLAEIKKINADIICLQEVQEDHYEEVFQPELKELGYSGMYKKRTGDKTDGCSIFYKADVFTLDKRVDIEYFRPDTTLLDRDNVGLLAVLKLQSEPTFKLCVATTHLLFNPKRGDIKLAQLQILLAELDKAAFIQISDGKRLYHPSIVCGDMNSTPYSPLYNFLVRGNLWYDCMLSGDVSGQYQGKRRGRTIERYDILLPGLGIGTDCRYVSELKACNAQDKEPSSLVPVLKHDFCFESAYNHTNTDGSYEVTTHHRKANCTVDYILFSVCHYHLKSSMLRLLGTLRLLSDHEVEEIGGLPNVINSSDHLALVAKFLVRKCEVD